MKASVLDAIFTHERHSADRHQQIVELIQASQRVESPVLRLTIDQPLRTSTTFGTQTAQYYVRVVAVNNSRSKATILSAVAHLEADHRTATAELDRRKSTVEVPENNGSATLSFETRNQQPLVNWQLARIELRLAQDAGATRTYMPRPGGTFQQV